MLGKVGSNEGGNYPSTAAKVKCSHTSAVWFCFEDLLKKDQILLRLKAIMASILTASTVGAGDCSAGGGRTDSPGQ